MLNTDGLMEKVPPGCLAKHVDGMLEVTAYDVIRCCVTIEWWANVVGFGSFVKGAGLQTEIYVNDNIDKLRSDARAFFAGLEATQESSIAHVDETERIAKITRSVSKKSEGWPP